MFRRGLHPRRRGSGKRPSLVDRRTGELRPVELFVAVLGASSLTYAEATATRQLGGLGRRPRPHGRVLRGHDHAVWVPDQLRSAITRPCRYGPRSTGPTRTWPPTTAPSSSRRAPESPATRFRLHTTRLPVRAMQALGIAAGPGTAFLDGRRAAVRWAARRVSCPCRRHARHTARLPARIAWSCSDARRVARPSAGTVSQPALVRCCK